MGAVLRGGGLVDRGVDVGEDLLRRGDGGFLGEADGGIDLLFHGLGDGVGLGVREQALTGEGGAEEGDRVAVVLVGLDLGLGAVFLGVGVGDGVSTIAIRAHFQQGGALALAGAVHGLPGAGADLVHGVAVDDGPVHAVAVGAAGERLAGGGAFLARAHGVLVVLDDEDDRHVPEGGEVERFVDGALVGGAVAHVAKAAALEPLVFEGVGESEAQWGLAADDAVAAPEMFRRGEEVHGAALALGAAGEFALQLGHELAHAHADGEGVAMVAVGGDDVVVLAQQRAGADGDGLLAVVEMEEAADPALLVDAQAAVLEGADTHHVGVELELFFRREVAVDRRLGVEDVVFGRLGAGEVVPWGRRWKVGRGHGVEEGRIRPRTRERSRKLARRNPIGRKL